VILVTGGTGFVGGHVVRTLRASNREVRVLVRDSVQAERLEVWGASIAVGDMTDEPSVRSAVQGCATVVHLVAIRQGSREQFRRVMVDGTNALLTAAKDVGVQRVLHMSALGTSEETSTLVPYYGAKWEAEQLVRESGLEHVIFRPSFVFAADGGILPTFTRLARLAPVTPIIGSGKQRIQPIWADDVAAYFDRAVDLEAATGRTFDLGGPDAVSWDEFWTRLKRVRGSRRPSVHVPVRLMRPGAFVTERLPGDIPLTNDLLTMLDHGDNVVSNDDATRIFGLPLVGLDEQLRRAAA
jgi:NADH dehydrogenase